MNVGFLLLLLGAGVIMILAVPVTASETTPATPAGITPLNQLKVASVYERVSDGIAFSRSTDDVITILNETNTSLIFRTFFRWQPVPESPDASLPGYPSSYVKGKADIGYTYSQMGDAIRQIKAARPNTIIVGAIADQYLNRIEFNDVTHASYSQSQTWAMAFDPSKYNMDVSKEDFQCQIAKRLGEIPSSTRCPSGYNPETVPSYFPDITNEQYQEILVSHAAKQIDHGADAIWIDGFFAQTQYFQRFSKIPNDPAKKAAYDASSNVIDRIHEYGEKKYGKHIYVGTWSTFTEVPYPPPEIDFVTVSPTAKEMTSGFDDSYWNTFKENVTNKLGSVPIYVFIDWNGSAGSPMGVFSQDLTLAEQKTFLQNADAFFTRKGMIFVYPIHGGTFPRNSARLSFGKYGIYDSIAPEFGTYDTIKKLAQEKSVS